MNEWIPCSKELPSKSGKYIITIEKANGDAYVTWAMFDDTKGGWNLTVPVDSSIIAWMFEPEPYRPLKPCPFCGNSELEVIDIYETYKTSSGEWQVRCTKCGGRQEQQPTKAQTIIKWNKRPDGRPDKEE